eukprot:TRINITY_DN7310_c0_g1_i1.p1 TRINITY_DN7310_c0_g1~~TRINITY_DN7310_c0_g1_i1.p1  ORF type:complete len:489 (-),score=93.14 TRINITY_DN7310_c0_g1_i1:405-1871(-)
MTTPKALSSRTSSRLGTGLKVSFKLQESDDEKDSAGPAMTYAMTAETSEVGPRLSKRSSLTCHYEALGSDDMLSQNIPTTYSMHTTSLQSNATSARRSICDEYDALGLKEEALEEEIRRHSLLGQPPEASACTGDSAAPSNDAYREASDCSTSSTEAISAGSAASAVSSTASTSASVSPVTPQKHHLQPPACVVRKAAEPADTGNTVLSGSVPVHNQVSAGTLCPRGRKPSDEASDDDAFVVMPVKSGQLEPPQVGASGMLAVPSLIVQRCSTEKATDDVEDDDCGFVMKMTKASSFFAAGTPWRTRSMSSDGGGSSPEALSPESPMPESPMPESPVKGAAGTGEAPPPRKKLSRDAQEEADAELRRLREYVSKLENRIVTLEETGHAPSQAPEVLPKASAGGAAVSLEPVPEASPEPPAAAPEQGISTWDVVWKMLTGDAGVLCCRGKRPETAAATVARAARPNNEGALGRSESGRPPNVPRLNIPK